MQTATSKVITFDDIEECHPAGPPISICDKPQIGEVIDQKKVLRVKPISAMNLTKLLLSKAEISTSLKLKQHETRPFVFWLCEVA
jgi:hypothetical protein